MMRYAYDYDLSSLDDLEGDKFDEHACAEIGQSFNRGLFESEGCRNFTTSGLASWTGVQAVALTGRDAPNSTEVNIDNSTDICHPTIFEAAPDQPRVLTPVRTTITNHRDGKEFRDFDFYGITPILTIWWPAKGTSVEQEPVARLNCMKLVKSPASRILPTVSPLLGVAMAFGLAAFLV